MPFSSTPVYVGAGDQVEIRYPTPSTWNTTVTIQVQIGTGVDANGVTLGTRLPDSKPATFLFDDAKGSTSSTASAASDFVNTFEKNTTYYSNAITVSGIELRVPISIATSGSGPKGTYPNLTSDAGFSINGGPYITTSTQSVNVTGTCTSGSNIITGVSSTANLVVGRYLSSTRISGEILAINGTNVTVTNLASSSGSATLTQYYTVTNNDTVRLRIKTENWYTTNSNVTLTISDDYWGTGNATSDTWSITTRAQKQQITTLTSGTFTDYVDVGAADFGTYKTQNITISGIDNDTVLRATATDNGQISKDGVTWSQSLTNLKLNDTLYTRLAIGSTYTTKTTGTFTVYAQSGDTATIGGSSYENNAAGTYGSSTYAVTQTLGTTNDDWQVWTEVDRYPNTFTLAPIFTRTDSLPLATVNSGGSGYTNGSTYSTTGGSGTGLTVKVTAASPTGNVVSVEVVERGSGYQIDDLLSITGGTSTAQVKIIQYRLVNVSSTNTLNNAEVGFTYYANFTVGGLGTEYTTGSFTNLESPLSGTSYSSSTIENYLASTVNGSALSGQTVEILCKVSQGSASIRKNGSGSWVQQLYVKNNDVVNVRQTASSSYNTTLTSTIEMLGPPNGGSIGGPTGGPSTPSFTNKTDTWTIKTRVARTDPYPFRAQHIYDATPGTQYVQSINIAGLDAATTASIVSQTSGANAQISLDNITYTNSISNFPSTQTVLYIRATSSTTSGGKITVSYKVGNVTDTLVLQTKKTNYEYTTKTGASSYYEYVLPQWSEAVDFVLVGAGGGNGGDDAPNSFGGRGGFGNVVAGTMSLPDSLFADPYTKTVRIYAPTKGNNGITFTKGASGGTGGYGYATGGNGGSAAAGEYSGAGGGGGGAAAIALTDGTLIVLAGGGGGGGGAGDDTVIQTGPQNGNYTGNGSTTTSLTGLNLTGVNGSNATSSGGGGGGGYGSGGTTNTSLVDEFGGTLSTVDLDAKGGGGGGAYYNSSYVTLSSTPSALGAGSNENGYVVLGIPPQDLTPDTFSFTQVDGAVPNTQYTTDYVQITGITGYVNVSITSNGLAQAVRVCDGQGTGCGSWSSTGVIVKNNQYIQARMTTGNNYFSSYTAQISVGTTTNYWNVNTGEPPDNSPNDFTIPALTDQTPNTTVESSIVTITGLNTSATITASNSAQISICNGTTCDAFAASPRQITNNQGFKLRITTSSSYSTKVTSTVTVGTSAGVNWDVTTGVQPDNTPSGFLFNTLTNRNLNTTYFSNSAVIQGIDSTITFSVTNSSGQTGTVPTIVLNDVETGLSSTTVSVYDTVKLKYTTSNVVGDSKVFNVTAGEYSTTWTVTNAGTFGTMPDAFSFTTKTATAVSTDTDSDEVTISGLGTSVGAFATNGALIAKKASGSSTYSSFNSYTSALPLSISNGDSIKIRLKSSPISGFSVTTNVTVGSFSTTYTVFSPAPTADPLLGQWYSSINMVQVSGTTDIKYASKFDGLPIGSIMPVFKNGEDPNGFGKLDGKADSRFPGWIYCDGSYVSSTDFPALYDLIGSTYGAASGGNFRLPDMRNKKLMGTGNVDGSSSSSPALVPTYGPAKTSSNASNLIPGSHGGLWYIDQTGNTSSVNIPQVLTPGTGLTATESDYFAIATISTEGYEKISGEIEFATSGTFTGAVGLKKTKLYEVPKHSHYILTGQPDPGFSKGNVRWGGDGGRESAVTTTLDTTSGPAVGESQVNINMWGYALQDIVLDSGDTVKSSRDASTGWLATTENWEPSPPYSGGPGFTGEHVTGEHSSVTLLQPNIGSSGTNFTEINSFIDLQTSPFPGTVASTPHYKWVGAVDIPGKTVSVSGFNPTTKNDHSHYLSLTTLTSTTTQFSYGNSNLHGTAVSSSSTPDNTTVNVVFAANSATGTQVDLGLEVLPGKFTLGTTKQLIPTPTLSPTTKVGLLTPYSWVRWLIKAY